MPYSRSLPIISTRAFIRFRTAVIKTRISRVLFWLPFFFFLAIVLLLSEVVCTSSLHLLLYTQRVYLSILFSENSNIFLIKKPEVFAPGFDCLISYCPIWISKVESIPHLDNIGVIAHRYLHCVFVYLVGVILNIGKAHLIQAITPRAYAVIH